MWKIASNWKHTLRCSLKINQQGVMKICHWNFDCFTLELEERHRQCWTSNNIERAKVLKIQHNILPGYTELNVDDPTNTHHNTTRNLTCFKFTNSIHSFLNPSHFTVMTAIQCELMLLVQLLYLIPRRWWSRLGYVYKM